MKKKETDSKEKRIKTQPRTKDMGEPIDILANKKALELTKITKLSKEQIEVGLGRIAMDAIPGVYVSPDTQVKAFSKLADINGMTKQTVDVNANLNMGQLPNIFSQIGAENKDDDSEKKDESE